jgi:single-stranded-DNA-specific exonuclease
MWQWYRPTLVTAFLARPTDSDASARIAEALKVHPVTAQLLVQRGLEDPDAARAFLNADVGGMHEPSLFQDMEAALDLIDGACRDGIRIAIYGDYDVDGVCSTAVLTRTLQAMGADVRPFIPHRVRDGYGLSGAALNALHDEGCGLVVTVDNGVTRAAEIAAAQERGLAVVVTDHHEPGPTMPPCPVINPKRADTTYPYAGLAGCGVAFKVALALAERRGASFQAEFKAILPDLLAMVAMGTVADVMPLLDENRILVRGGLKALAGTSHPGLRALLQVSRCEGRVLRASDIGFRIGPRINAAGRLDSAHLALDLILCTDPTEAKRLAKALDAGNRERQKIERKHSDEAIERAERTIAESNPAALVIAGQGWHPGVIGIVAARVAERFKRPAAMIAVDGDEGKGSARSSGGVRLHEALASASEHLQSHGGHALAAGFTLAADSVDAFRTAFIAAVQSQGQDDSDTTLVDAELPLDAIQPALARELELLEPYGASNREPIFFARGVRLAGKPRFVGKDGTHLIFFAAGDKSSWRAVAFKQAASAPLLDNPFDMAFCIRPREDREGLELHVREIVSAR